MQICTLKVQSWGTTTLYGNNYIIPHSQFYLVKYTGLLNLGEYYYWYTVYCEPPLGEL